MRKFIRNKGFTLIEILIVLLISSLLMTAVYSTYRTQQKAYLVQDQVANMQQNLRAAMHMLERDIRMAGYDPLQAANAGITTAAISTLIFTIDDNGDGDTDGADETIAYTFDDANSNIQRNGRIVAENIEELDFIFLDKDGVVLGDSEPDGITDDPDFGDSVDTGDIRSIEVTIVAKTPDGTGDWKDLDYTNNNTYNNAQGGTVFSATGDNIRRMVITKRVRCRNLGLTGGQ